MNGNVVTNLPSQQQNSNSLSILKTVEILDVLSGTKTIPRIPEEKF